MKQIPPPKGLPLWIRALPGVAILICVSVMMNVAMAQDKPDLSSIPEPAEVATDGMAIESVLAIVGLDAAWRATTGLGEIPRAMTVRYSGEDVAPVADLLATTVALDSTTSLHSEVVSELRDVALEHTAAVDTERARLIDRNRADAHLRGMVALLRSVALDMFAGNGDTDDILLGTDGDALLEVQRTHELRGHTLEEMIERRAIAIAALADAEQALADATAHQLALEAEHIRLLREATTLARSRNELESEARALLPVAADAFALADVPRAHGLTPRAVEAYVNAELTMSEQKPNCRISWRTIAAIGAVEGAHGSYGGRTLQRDAVPDRPIIGLALNGTNTDNFGEVVANIADTDRGRWDGDAVHDRAVGPMQFIPETWTRWAGDGDADGVHNPQDLDDAALAAAGYLCNYGSHRSWETWKAAVFGYNHSPAYVASVKSAHNQVRRVVLPDIDTSAELQPSAPWGTYVPMPIPEPVVEPGPDEESPAG